MRRMMKEKFTRFGLIGGGSAVLLGVLLIISGIISFYVIKNQLRKAVEDYIVVDSIDNDNYEDWQDNTQEDAAPLYVDFYFFNLTNGDEVLSGSEPPSYTTVGPYVYRKLFKKINVTFTNDGDTAELGWWTYYVHEPQLSNASLVNDSITNLNEAYVYLVSQAGSESNLIFGASPGFVSNILSSLQLGFAPQVVQQAFPAVAKNYHDNLLAVYNNNATHFYEIWANDIVVPSDTPLWQAFGILSANQPSGSNLSVSECEFLWSENPNIPNLANNDTVSTTLWTQASLGNPVAQNNLTQILSISPAQLSLVLNWRNSFNTRVTEPFVLNQFGVTSGAELAWLQFGSGVVTNYTSIQSTLSLPIIPEIGIWSRDVYTNNSADYINFNASFTAFLFSDNSTGLTQLKNLQELMFYLQTSNAQSIEDIWHLTLPQALAVSYYFRYIGSGLVAPTIQSTFPAGGGLITTRTAEQWLWGAVDPLLRILYPTNDVVSYYQNQTTEQDADKYLEETGFSIIYTGNGDVNDVSKYKQWEGKEELPAGQFWGENVVVTGTQGTQFSPNLNKDDELTVWVDEVVRPLRFVYDREVKEKGIDLLRYDINSDDFLPSDIYFSNETGFANMTNTYGIPVMMSKPRFLDCDPKWAEKLEGVTPNREADDTYLDVEPMTGRVMKGVKQLQVAIYVQEEGAGPLNFDVWNTRVKRDVIFPVFYAKEHSVITDSQADDFKDSVYKTIMVRNVLFWLGLGIGVILVVVGVLVIAIVVYKHKKRYEVYGYQELE